MYGKRFLLPHQSEKRWMEKMLEEIPGCKNNHANRPGNNSSACAEKLKKYIVELNLTWDKITAPYTNHEEKVVEVMKKVVEFHETLNVNFQILSLMNMHRTLFSTRVDGVLKGGYSCVPENESSGVGHWSHQGPNKASHGVKSSSRPTDNHHGSPQQVVLRLVKFKLCFHFFFLFLNNHT